MRLLFGIVLGIAITLGAAYVHDNNVPADPPSVLVGEHQIVNWDILGAVVRRQMTNVKQLWNQAFGK